ncbi:DUF6443 domain-containing protein [Winogradskyella sp. PC D3.3]
MLKNIFIYFILLFSISASGQIHSDEAFDEFNYVKALSPQERVNYLETGSWQFRHWFYSENGHYWSLRYTDPNNVRINYIVKFYKYFLDSDNDNFMDENNYVCFYSKRTTTNSSFSTTDPESIKSNNFMYNNLGEIMGDIYRRSIQYLGVTWKRIYQSDDRYGNDHYSENFSDFFDCDDNNYNLGASTVVRYWVDNDGDGYGTFFGSRYFPLGCPSDGYSLNRDDCNDNDSSITTQPVNWYEDRDEDGYGNPNAGGMTACRMPTVPSGIKFVNNSDDCNDLKPEYNNEDLIWYADFDNDGFGDENDYIIASCPQIGYVSANSYFDKCPTEAGTRDGCPIIQYDFDNTNQNYTYERVYLEEFKVNELQSVTSEDVLEQISYYDGAKRTKQQIALGIALNGKDIMQHFEYDGNGERTKSYLPFMNTTSGMYEPNALAGTLNYYNTSDYENTTNPYSETITEASPLKRVLEQGAPGEDWLVDKESDYDHTIKYEYDVNTANSIKKFSVIHSNDFIENTELNYDGFYANNELYKVTVKNENWKPNPNPSVIEKNNTEETYKNHLGQEVLKRVYVDNEPHDTYYIYDDLGNLTYVLPPKASDQILDFGEQAFRVAAQTNYSWVNLVSIDKSFAEEYNKQLLDYDNVNILNADIENKYGGQGGFSVTTFDDSELVTLSISFSSIDEFELKQGNLISLKPYGKFKDSEIGRISGVNYNYIFSIKNNTIVIEGGGKLSSVNSTLNSNTKLDYDKNYLWVQYIDVDEKFAYEHEEEVNQIAKNTGESILNINAVNQYDGQGGLNVTIDSNDNITLTFNSSHATPLKLKNGAIFSLGSKRRLQNRELGSISGINFNYTFDLENNTIIVRGTGVVTSFNGIVFSPPPPPPPIIIPQTVEGLSYIYHYDYRKRIVEKKTPDKGWEHIVYNKLDQPVLTQDAKMRLNNEWLFIKYDALARPIYSGLYKYEPTGSDNNSARIELQDILDNQTFLFESKINSIQNINGTSIFYTNNTYPNTNDLELHSINYYDDYNGLETGNSDLIKSEGDFVYDESITMATRNLPTLSKTRVLGTDNWITSVIYYDENATPIYVASKNDYLNTLDIVETDSDFVGKVLETKTYHGKQYSNDIITVDKYTYDHAGRLLTQTQRINDATPELIVNNTYNDLGQLISKKVGGIVDSGAPEDSEGLQTVDYSYNIRGWLNTINSGVISGNDLFGYKLNYNTIELNGSTPLFNGNISETHWMSKGHHNEFTSRAYAYNYDEINRLEGANYFLINSNVNEDYSVKMNYDKNGNILALARMGQVITNTIVNNTPTESISMDYIDILSYSYGDKSNQLKDIKDTATKEGFIDDNDYGESGVNDYNYDINGNLTKDINKKISITYNHLNLPVEIKYRSSNAKKIEYTYAADGRKLSKVVTNDGNITTNLYAGKYIYENNRLKVFLQPEGYVEPNSSNGLNYVYQYKDHLGNVRLSYKKNILETHLDDAFYTEYDGWTFQGGSANGSIELENGRLKVNVKEAFNGAQFLLGSDFSIGDKIEIHLDLDKGTTDRVRILLIESDGNGNWSGHELENDADTNSYSFVHTITTLVPKLSLKVDKSNTNNGVDTYFYLDNVSSSLFQLEIVKENSYYPFGLEHQGDFNITSADANTVASKFKYNGTELEESFGINLYEMPFRQYDPAIARWTSIDPVTHFSMSPYTGFDNNPVYWSDPSGANSQDFDYENDYDRDYSGDPRESNQIYDDPIDENWLREYLRTMGWDLGALDQVIIVGSRKDEDNGGDYYDEFDDWYYDVDFDLDKGFDGSDNGPTWREASKAIEIGFSALENRQKYLSTNYKTSYGTATSSAAKITSQTRGLYASVAKNARIGGAFVTVVTGSIDIANGIKADGGEFGINAQIATGGMAGGLAGAWAGAKAGALLGALIPIPGAALVGGFVGGIAGAWYGDMKGREIAGN